MDKLEIRKNAEVLLDSLKFRGLRVVDVGAGDGNLTRLLAKAGARVTGIECSPRQLAKARAAERVSDEEILEGVGQSLPFADASVDVVVFFNSLHHVPVEEMGAALREAARVLKPEGRVYVCEPLAEGVFYEVCRPVDDEAQVRKLAYESLLAARELRMEREFRYINPVQLASYEAFQERIISANSEREATFARMDTQMRALFAAKASPDPVRGGFVFEQPMRVNVLRKA